MIQIQDASGKTVFVISDTLMSDAVLTCVKETYDLGAVTMKRYNGLTSVKIYLAEIGICPLDGRRFTDPQCTHGTPEQVEACKRIDVQIENEYAARQAFRNRAILYDEAAEREQREICAAFVSANQQMVDTFCAAVSGAFIVDGEYPIDDQDGCANDDMRAWLQGGR